MRVLDHGEIKLLDWMPQEDLDNSIAEAARVSYGEGTKSTSSDRSLIRYLLRHGHTSPFEMVEFKWYIKCPVFVARQWVRHRTASLNEVSARYSDMSEVEFYGLPTVRGQSSTNKQCSSGTISDGDTIRDIAGQASSTGLDAYRELLRRGVAREQARCVLPVSMYTEFIWKCDLHNTLRFLRLRMHPHAQEEIRVYAEEMYKTLKALVPITMEAWEDYELNAITLTALEIQALNTGHMSDRATEREVREYEDKRKVLRGIRPIEPSVYRGATDQAQTPG